VSRLLFSSFLVIASSAAIVLLLSVLTPQLVELATGQAEETFGQNSTFLEEVEQTRGQQQDMNPLVQNQTNTTTASQGEVLQQQQQLDERGSALGGPLAPMAVSGDDVFIVWSTNRTGNWEVMLRKSNDGGSTFGESINLSNTSRTDSVGPDITISGDNILVSWREYDPKAGTSDSLIRKSNDRGQSFGPAVKLSASGSLGESESPFASNYTTFESSTYGIQLRYPSEWEEREGDGNSSDDGVIDIAGFYSPLEDRLDNYRERLWLSMDNLRGDDVTVEEYAEEVVVFKNETADEFELLDSDAENTILAGNPAYRIISTQIIDDGTTVKEMEIGTKVANRIYFLTYYADARAYSDYLPEIQEIINSVEIGQ
jgi:hypothetical protein